MRWKKFKVFVVPNSQYTENRGDFGTLLIGYTAKIWLISGFHAEDIQTHQNDLRSRQIDEKVVIPKSIFWTNSEQPQDVTCIFTDKTKMNSNMGSGIFPQKPGPENTNCQNYYTQPSDCPAHVILGETYLTICLKLQKSLQ